MRRGKLAESVRVACEAARGGQAVLWAGDASALPDWAVEELREAGVMFQAPAATLLGRSRWFKEDEP